MKKVLKIISISLIVFFIIFIIKYYISFQFGNMFVDLFMSDVELLPHTPLSRGTLLWPKLKSAIVIGAIAVVLIMIGIYVFTGYIIEKKTKDRVEKECSQILDKIMELNNIPEELRDTEYNNFISTLKVFFYKYYLKDEEAEKDKDRIKDELIANFTHDIKTPLTSVIGYLKLLESDEDMSEKSRKKYTEVALSKSLYLGKLLDELFYISKYDFDHRNKTVERVNLTMFLNQLKDEFYPQLMDKSIKLELQIEEDAFIFTNVEELAKALGNVLKNAISYGYKESDIILEAMIIGKDLTLSIKNKSDTLSEHEISLIFTRFYRSDSSRNSTKGGSGLGLAISKAIIENLGGKISASSNNNCFTMTIHIPNAVNENKIR